MRRRRKREMLMVRRYLLLCGASPPSSRYWKYPRCNRLILLWHSLNHYGVKNMDVLRALLIQLAARLMVICSNCGQ
jgi:hypothetical protein